MIKKAVFLAILLVVLSIGSAFAYEIDGLLSGDASQVLTSPTQVFVNPGGLGDVLLYGYYNVRNGYETFFTVTNTDTANGARVRIRFREAATLALGKPTDCDNGSQEILDFDICLSPGDMWTGVIVSDSNGAGTLHGLDTDTFVQVANPTGNPAVDFLIFPTAFPNGQEFKFGTGNLGITADQTREGYFEIIGERLLHGHLPSQASYLACTMDPTKVSGNNPLCTCGNMLDYANGTSFVHNQLMGQAYIVNPATTATFGYVATAIADFASTPNGKGDITPSPLFGANVPNLRDSSESGTIIPVNYALTKSNLYSFVDLDPSRDGRAGYIVVFPTKWATHQDLTNDDGSCATLPDDIFDKTDVVITEYDDKENSPTIVCQFSPCTTPGNKLPDEVNFLDLDDGGIFTSDGLVPLAVAGNFTGLKLGWITIDLFNGPTSPTLGQVHQTICTGATCLGSGGVPRTTHGLPAIGYQVERLAGGKVSGMMPLQYKTNVTVGADD